MNKNILIIGPSRSSKTTLSRKISKEYGYNVINLDDIICAFEKLPVCSISHDGNDIEVAKNFSKFLRQYLIELSEGANFYNGIRYVIEGTHIDFNEIMSLLNQDKYKEKYDVIGLLYNDINEEELYNNIKKYDNEDEWTYYLTSEDLRGSVRYFIKRNKYFNDKFLEYGIKTYDVSKNREEVLSLICNELFKNIRI